MPEDHNKRGVETVLPHTIGCSAKRARVGIVHRGDPAIGTNGIP